MEKITMRFNKRECMGCHACEVACKQEHGLGVGPRLVRVIEKTSDFYPIYCRHCSKPPCKDACPVEAISRNERGIVLIDNDFCIGCGECIEVCPFEAMQFEDEREIALKCDLCVDRLSEDKLPACMAICPTGCIQFTQKRNIAAVFERRDK